MKKIISTARAPKAIGPYNQGVIDTETGFLYSAGQLALDPETGQFVGTNAREQTHQIFRNLKAILEAAGCGFPDVIKTTIFLKNMDDFAAVNEIYAEYFTGDYPARSTVEVARLPKDGILEIELIAKVPSAKQR